MARSFRDLSSRAQQSWTADTRSVYDAAVETFGTELDARAALGAQLQAARTAHGLSQPALAERSGLQQAEISRIETGAGNPTADTLLRLAHSLDLEVVFTPRVGRRA